ncbi:protein decapping 5 isoform X2 [Vicia villosa]|uniref:protein decapping 5 isoform X2 n=1 Tax=Vicia villosa TaxID=3911 RepID=UPI00273B5FD3|nr:protein decapping 5 isoform X2 [Vicia villosa]
MASENGSRSGSAADSYVGSLISLTSKSEIRYEGILYNINTQESSIGLTNVRSFGTEGRKKDGPQIPPGDKVYEYILFRGTDIKDLQVKSSPPVHPSPQENSDPAIIQSHYSHSIPTSTNLPSGVSGSFPDLNSHTPQLGLPGSSFQGPLPLYQPGGSIGSWGASPPAPNANGGGLAMPMYWQGYYGASPNGLPHLHQQSLLRPPPGLSMPSSMQQPMHYPNFSLSLPTVSSNLPELPSSLLPLSTSTPSVTSASLPLSNFPPAASALTPDPSATLASEVFPVSATSKSPIISTSTVALAASLPSMTPSTDSGVQPISSKTNVISNSSLPYQTVSHFSPAAVGSSNSIRTETPGPTLVTPGQLLQSGPTIVSSAPPSRTPHKDVEVVQVSSTSSPEQSLAISTETKPPILPLPVTSGPSHRSGRGPMQTHHNGYSYRGRGRGRGTGFRPVTKFTEDFDFMAMNEKFKKDEVWGHLGKSNKCISKDKDGEENAFDEDYSLDEDNDNLSNVEVKPVYNKDDFFDSLSSSVLDNASQNGRTRYSEQIKIDTETFGNFSRYRGGQRGRGGRNRGGYYGRGGGYGYSGRGRGHVGMPHRSS